jgi:hypothetical protein
MKYDEYFRDPKEITTNRYDALYYDDHDDEAYITEPTQQEQNPTALQLLDADDMPELVQDEAEPPAEFHFQENNHAEYNTPPHVQTRRTYRNISTPPVPRNSKLEKELKFQHRRYEYFAC